MQIDNWQKIKTERMYDGFEKIDKTTFKLPNGKLKDFDIINLPGPSALVASVFGMTAKNQVILAKQYRPGPEKVFYEFPVGMVEEDETPLEGAKREFLEETGYTGDFKKAGVKYLGGYDKTAIHCFIALNCCKATDKLKLDEGEFIEVVLKPLAEVRQMLKKGEIRNFGEGYLALDHLGLL